jgi:imidazolonepropionase-like amidohydrolase
VGSQARAPAGAQGPDPPLLIRNVTVIDPEVGARADLDVLVVENRIEAVGPAGALAIPPGARVLSGAGRYLLPGLWDMHVHLSVAAESALPLFVAHGVLGVRDMGSDPWPPLRRFRAEALSGGRVGPRIAIAGPILDGPTPSWPLRLTVRNPAEGSAAVDSLAIAGVDLIKVHQQLDRPTYFAIARAARRLGVPFAGHVPPTVTGLEAVRAGQRTLEHLTGIPPIGTTAFDSTVAALASSRVWVTPTLLVYWILAHRDDDAVRHDPRIAVVAPSARAFWDFQKTGWSGDMTVSAMRQGLAAMRAGVAALRQGGVRLLVGSDLGFIYTYPGSSVHDELALLVDAGLSPLEAIAAATVNPARALGREAELGSVAAGKLADLVLLEANPLDDIRHTRRIAAVVANGRLLDRPALDRILRDAAERR